MIYMIKKGALQIVSNFLTIVAKSTVNSVCWYGLGQEKEPESLNRLKK